MFKPFESNVSFCTSWFLLNNLHIHFLWGDGIKPFNHLTALKTTKTAQSKYYTHLEGLDIQFLGDKYLHLFLQS